MKSKLHAFLFSFVFLFGAAQAQETATPTDQAVPSATATDEPLRTPPAASVPTQTVAPVVVTEEPAAPVVETAPRPEQIPEEPPVARPSMVPAPIVARGRWSGDITAASSLSFGNTSGHSINLSSDVAYQRPEDKISLSAMYMESAARSYDNGVPTTSITALQWRLGGRYDRDLTQQDFGFFGMEFSQDYVRRLALRSVTSTGLGRHLWKERWDQWDVFAGLTYREDYYYSPGVMIDGTQRTRYQTVEVLLGQESTHAITDTTKLRQRFVYYPNLYDGKGTRATLDAGLQVDIDKSFSLSVKVQGRYDSMIEGPAEKYDLLFLTGITVRFDR